MYLAYSALRKTTKQTDHKKLRELQLRYQAYQTACRKYSNQLAMIQQYLPGWLPAPPSL